MPSGADWPPVAPAAPVRTMAYVDPYCDPAFCSMATVAPAAPPADTSQGEVATRACFAPITMPAGIWIPPSVSWFDDAGPPRKLYCPFAVATKSGDTLSRAPVWPCEKGLISSYDGVSRRVVRSLRPDSSDGTRRRTARTSTRCSIGGAGTRLVVSVAGRDGALSVRTWALSATKGAPQAVATRRSRRMRQ